MNELDNLLIHFRPPNKFNFFLIIKKTQQQRKANKFHLVDFFMCSVALWSPKALTGVKNLPHFLKLRVVRVKK